MSSSASSYAALSGALKDLADNPSGFLMKHPILFEPVSLPQEYRSTDGSSFKSGTAGVKLVQSKTVPANYNLQFVAIKDLPTDKEAVNAYVLAYKNNRGNDDVPFVDIPTKAFKENTFLFTVGLTGCSVIVTSIDKNTYRVFHDRRMDSSVLYDNVQMRVDFNDYRIGGELHPLFGSLHEEEQWKKVCTPYVIMMGSFPSKQGSPVRISGRFLSHTGKAITLLLFKGGAWKMFLQRQLPPLDTRLPTWEVYANAVQQRGPVTEKAFNDRRTIIQNRVKANGKNLKVDEKLIKGAVDGIAQGVVYNKKEPAIRGWNDVRAAIKSKIDIYHNNPNRDRKLKDTYERFALDNRDSAEIDETWIWLQIKKKKKKKKNRA